MMARTAGNPGLLVVARFEYRQSASMSNEKSSSAVQDVELTITRREPARSRSFTEAVSDRDSRNLFRSLSSKMG
jgi:hypothetical protein